MPLTDDQAAEIRAALKRCRPETVDAALRFRETGNPVEVPAIAYGIIERHLAPEVSQKMDLHHVDEGTRLIEDLGVDSLTMLEIVLSIEETMAIRIENEELKDLRTLGDVRTFISQKLGGGVNGNANARSRLRRYDFPALATILPHDRPFLFLDEAEIEQDVVRARYTVKGDEDFLAGHFKGNPVFPASIVFEALGQAACLWVLECAPERLNLTLPNHEVLFASMENAHFHRRARPGDTLELEATLHQLHAPLAVFDGIVRLRGERLAQIERLVLAFGQEIVEHLDEREEHSEPVPVGATTTAGKVAAVMPPSDESGASIPRRRPSAAKKKVAVVSATKSRAPRDNNGAKSKPASDRRSSPRSKTAS